MRIFKKDQTGVVSIEFCCNDMAEDILSGVIKTSPWTTNALVFRVGDYKLSHCGHCGAKIEDELFRG
jgi:hypothetical protein